MYLRNLISGAAARVRVSLAKMDAITRGGLHRRDYEAHPNANPAKASLRGRATERVKQRPMDAKVAALRAENRAENASRRRHEKLTTNPKKLRRQIRREARTA